MLAGAKRFSLTLPWFDNRDASSTSLFFFRLRDHFPRRVRRLVAVRRDAAPSRHPRPQHDVLQPQRRVVLHLAGQEVRLPFAWFAQSEFRRQDQRSGRTSDPLSEFKGLNPAATRAYPIDIFMALIFAIVSHFNLSVGKKSVDQVSISPIFYEQLFHTKVFCAALMCLQFGFVIFWQKDFGARAAHKMLVK